MSNWLRDLYGKSLVRYVLVGGLSYAVELVALYGLILFVEVEKVLAVGVAFWIGLVISFVLQKIVAFRDRHGQASHLTKQAAGYALLVLINYIFTLLFVHVLTRIHVDLFIARTLALIITTLWNYFVYKMLLFKAID